MRPRWLLVSLSIAACAPSVSTPQVHGPQLPTLFEGGASTQNVGTLDWRAYFGDEHLDALIDEAIAHNFDVKIAIQRIAIARAGVLQASGARLPQVALFADAGLTKFGRYTADGAGNASTDIRAGQRVPTHLTDFELGLTASWESDIWGRLRNLHGAARARYLSTVEGTYLVVTNLVASVASEYVELVALDRTQQILTETITRQTEALEIMRVEKQAGRTNELAVQQFEAQLANTKALAAATLARTREIENEINLLLGRGPQAVARTPDLLQRQLPATYATGVPSDLLRNRSDIRDAELQVEATKFDLAAARAAFYPRLAISATLGYDAFDPRFLLSTPASIAYSVGANLLAPIVNRRAIRAEFDAAEATQVQAMYNYQGIILRAFFEVATELYALQQAAEIVAQQNAKMDAVRGTVDAADALFRAGKATYLEVLIAQQNTLDGELQLVAALRDQRLAMVRLYKALGGGWRGTLVEAQTSSH